MNYIKSVERIFWPVGQGAFYSEKLKFDDGKEFNIVYDCGSKKKELVHPLIDEFFEGTTIDILFISHFDSDHVNGIPELKNKAKIKNVVIPLIHNNDKILLDFYYDEINKNEGLRTLVSSPEDFFGKETNVISVTQGNRSDESRLEETFNIDNVNGQKRISSGRRLTISNYEWIFIPHNIHFNERSEQLNQALTNIGKNIEDLTKIEDFDGPMIKKIRDIFNSKEIEGTINSNSMFLYSGFENKAKNLKFKSFNNCFIHHNFMTSIIFKSYYNNILGCLYTGDGNLSKNNYKNIKNIYKNYWEGIGTIQVPHHGSSNSSDENLYNEKNKIFVISAGEKEWHDHPDNEVKNGLSKNNFVHHVSYEIYMQKYIENYCHFYCWCEKNYMINLDIPNNIIKIHKNQCNQIHKKGEKREFKFIFKSFDEYLRLKAEMPPNLIKNGFWIQNLEKSQVILNDKPNRLYLEELFDSYSEKSEGFKIKFCGTCIKHLRKGVKK
jgi:hypothetical protein